MPEVNFDVEEAANYEITVPPGKYLVRCDEIRETFTKENNECWNLTLTIIHGEHKGNQIYDPLFFTERAMPRVKLVCHRLGGLEGTGYVTVNTTDLLNKSCYVAVVEKEDDFNAGKMVNKVAYAGYYAIENQPTEKRDGEKAEKPRPENDLPF